MNDGTVKRNEGNYVTNEEVKEFEKYIQLANFPSYTVCVKPIDNVYVKNKDGKQLKNMNDTFRMKLNNKLTVVKKDEILCAYNNILAITNE